jgi:hypothetical protein
MRAGVGWARSERKRGQIDVRAPAPSAMSCEDSVGTYLRQVARYHGLTRAQDSRWPNGRDGRRGRPAHTGRIQPAARRLDHPDLPLGGTSASGPRPGGNAWADASGRAVRLAARQQAFDLRIPVDQAPTHNLDERRPPNPRPPQARLSRGSRKCWIGAGALLALPTLASLSSTSA